MKLLEMKEEKENSPNQSSLAITWPPHNDKVPSSTQVALPGRNAKPRHVQLHTRYPVMYVTHITC